MAKTGLFLFFLKREMQTMKIVGCLKKNDCYERSIAGSVNFKYCYFLNFYFLF